MKRLVAVVMVLTVALAVAADEQRPGLQVGLQMASDSFMTVLLYSPRVEFGLKAQVHKIDNQGDDRSTMMIGTQAGYLFHPAAGPYDFSVGAEARALLEMNEEYYSEYFNLGLRLALNYRLHRNVLLSGILHPVWLEIFSVKGQSGTDVDGLFPRASLALALLF
jgi:hypothetical protein